MFSKDLSPHPACSPLSHVKPYLPCIHLANPSTRSKQTVLTHAVRHPYLEEYLALCPAPDFLEIRTTWKRGANMENMENQACQLAPEDGEEEVGENH